MAVGDEHVSVHQLNDFAVRLTRVEQAGHDPDNGDGRLALTKIETTGVGTVTLGLRPVAGQAETWRSRHVSRVRAGQWDTINLTVPQRARIGNGVLGLSMTMAPHDPALAQPPRLVGRPRALVDEITPPGGGGG